ncbi:phage tail tape measure protein [Paenibacillus sp. NRS-1760]|uniref:phage tail tape measure protein n=1 Tax=Paenibacillus sp. NRS-1760 TaxID=3233902 RepID=UPI003D296397
MKEIEALNKDVVGASLKLDITKMTPAFKVIDGGARKNAESFKVLNTELAQTEKSYVSLAKAADKIAMNSDERRQKMIAESNALVAQRKAQAELLAAKTAALNKTNQIVDEKLKAQQAIVKKRSDAIEQQELEHQKRMQVLQNRVISTSATSAKSTGTDDTTRERVLQAEHRMRRQLEIEERSNVQRVTSDRERSLQYEQRVRREIARQEVMQAEQLRRLNNQGMLNRSSQYMLSQTMYSAVVRGGNEAIAVLKNFEYELVNVKRVMGDTADVAFVKESMINSAKEYGYALKEASSVYTLIAQSGFNERETEALTTTALMAKNVEQSFQSAAQAQELMTGAVLNYGLAAEDSARLLDRINEVSNNYPTTSKKILEGMNRVGAAAKNAKVPINELIGYLTVLNQAGFSGANAGNAIKSFISFSSRDIAIDKLEKYVGVIKQANGEMMPFSEILSRISVKWDTLADSQRHEITQAIARGDQASKFIALMNNYSKVMEIAETAENSFGSAQRENALAMETLEKKSQQLKANWDQLIVTIGDSGLLGVLKAVVDTSKLLINGFNSIPGPIRNTLTATLLLGAGIMTLNTGMRLMTGQSIVSMVTGLASGARAMLGMSAATNAATVAQRGFIATPIGIVLTGISLALGAATVAWSAFNGVQNEAVDTTKQAERDAYTLTEKYKELKTVIDDNTQSDKEITAAKAELANVIERMSKVMPDMISQWDENGKAIDINTEKIKSFGKEYADALRMVEEEELRKSKKSRETLKNDLDILIAFMDAQKAGNKELAKSLAGDVADITGRIINANKINPKVAKEIVEVSEQIGVLDERIKNSQQSLDVLNGKLNNTADATDEFRLAMTESANETEMAEDAIVDVGSAMEDLQKAIDNSGTAIADLNQLLADLASGQSLNAQSAADLITQYPQLADKIYQTVDGWSFEESAVKSVRQAKLELLETSRFAQAGITASMYSGLQSRLEYYGIELDSISSLAEAQSAMEQMTKGIGVHSLYVPESVTQLAKIVAIREKFSKLSADPSYGVQSTKEKAPSSSKKEEDPLAKAFAASQKYIEHQKAMGRLSTQAELSAWERVQSQYIKGSDQRMAADEKVYALKLQLIEEAKKKEQDSYNASSNWISHQKGIREVSAKEELAWLERVQSHYKKGSEIRLRLDEQVYAAKKAAMRETMALSESFIAHEKAMGRLSLEEELKAWERVQARYLKGTEERKRSDEQVYALKKQLIDKETADTTKLIGIQDKALEKAKKDNIQRINDEKDAFIAAQDEKIKTIDAVIASMKEQNADDDYEAQLAEKRARLLLLQSAVGPEGIKEREDLIKEIAKMELDRGRELAIRSLEADKKKLEEEKAIKVAAYEDQVKTLETHYDALISAFKDFSDDTIKQSDTLKQIQILKESEKNAEILTQLDAFITAYQSKMSKISSISMSQEERDLQEYNNNKDLWDAAKASGDKSKMASLAARNKEIRDLYNVKQDTGKLQHFSEGGAVLGNRGAAVPVIAHAGELIFNERQQSNLFKLLNFAMPNLSYSMPSFSMASGSSESVVNHNYYTVSHTGDVNIDDSSTAKTYWTERDNVVRRFQSRGGKSR